MSSKSLSSEPKVYAQTFISKQNYSCFHHGFHSYIIDLHNPTAIFLLIADAIMALPVIELKSLSSNEYMRTPPSSLIDLRYPSVLNV